MKVLIVEDDRKLQSFIARALNEEGYVTDICRTGREALEQLGQITYDLVVLDWMLPEGDGLSVCRSLRERGSRVPVLMLTARDDVGEKVLALDAGADDYVTKPFHLAEFLARVRSLLRRTAESQVSTLRVGALSLDLRHRVLHVQGRRIELTGRELGLLEVLMRNTGRVVTRTEILDQVWGVHFDPESNVIEVHMRRLREKLGDAAASLETVRGQGYRMASPGPST